MNKVISIDVGGTFVKHGLLDEKGSILCSGKSPTQKRDAGNFINSLSEIIESYMKDDNVIGVAISMPGFINNNEGILISSDTFKFIKNYNIKGILETRTGLRVEVENDANCAALAEKFNGNAAECDDFICITIGTGIGGGIYLNGNIVRGKQFKGGEFCYMITKDKKNYQKLSENSSITGLVNMYKDYKGLDEDKIVYGEDVFREVDKDESIKNIINEWYENIGRMIYNLSAILNPEKILIGGGVSARSELLDELNSVLEKIPSWNLVKCEVEKCKHENNSGLIGAVYNFLSSN